MITIKQIGIIYLITNTVNDKKYVGQTINTIQHRWNQHLADANGDAKYAIHRAIQKYGADSFTIEKIENCTLAELNEREIYWIAYYNSFGINGYNLTIGGDGARKLCDKEALEIVKLWGYGHGVKDIAFIVECSEGTVHTVLVQCEVTKEEFVKRANENRNLKLRKVIQIDITTGEIYKTYNSISEAAKVVHRSPSAISDCLIGRTAITGGYLWKYLEDVSEEELTNKRYSGELPIKNKGVERKVDWEEVKRLWDMKMIQLQIAETMGCTNTHISYILDSLGISREERKQRDAEARGRRVAQISKDGKIVADHFSVCEAERRVNRSNSNIIKAIKQNTICGGYYWRYTADVSEEDLASGHYSGELPPPKPNSGRFKLQPVIQLTLSNKYVAEYSSIAEAERNAESGLKKNISRVCNGVRSEAYGYRWMYKVDYIIQQREAYRELAKPKLELLPLEKLQSLYSSSTSDKSTLIAEIIEDYIERSIMDKENQTKKALDYRWMPIIKI